MTPSQNTLSGSAGAASLGSQVNRDSLITKKEAAARLAISIRTLDRLVAQGLIEKVFVGRSVRIREKEIAAIVERGV